MARLLLLQRRRQGPADARADQADEQPFTATHAASGL
jgi:hypothetical protein